MKPALKVHWTFWLICSLLLIWNIMGCLNFIVQMNPEALSNYRESEQFIIIHRPLWATIVFFIAMFSGALGSLLLLLKKPAAYYLLIASLLAVIVTVAQTLTLGIAFKQGEFFGIVASPIIVAVFSLAYFIFAKHKQWISNNK